MTASFWSKGSAPCALSRPQLLAATIISALAGLYWVSLGLGVELTACVDTTNYLGTSRDCLSGKGCLLRLNPTGAASACGVYHGALFTHFLVLWHGIGLPESLLPVGWRVLMLLAFIPVMWAASLGAGVAGLLVAGLSASSVLRGYDGAVLFWNPDLIPFPAALFMLSAVCAMGSGERRYLFGAALAVGVALQAHSSVLLSVPALIYLAWVVDPRARRQNILKALSIVVVTTALVSPATFPPAGPPFIASGGESGRHLLTTGLGVWFFAVAVSLALLSTLLGSSRALVVRWARFLLLTQLLPALVMLSLAPSGIRYVLQFVPGLVCASGLAVRLLVVDLPRSRWGVPARGSPWLGRAVLLVVSIVAVSELAKARRQREPPVVTARGLTDWKSMRQLGVTMSQEVGLGYNELFATLRGGEHYYHLLEILGYMFPAVETHRGIADERALEVHPVYRNEIERPLPEGWQELSGDPLSYLTHEYRPFVLWESFAYCFRHEDAPGKCDLRFGRRQFHPTPTDRYGRHFFPRMMAILRTLEGEGEGLTYVLRVRLPAGARPRTVALPSVHIESATDVARARIQLVGGVDFEGELPSNRLRLLPPPAEAQDAHGFLVLTAHLARPPLDNNRWRLPPPMVELDEEHLPVPLDVLAGVREDGAPEGALWSLPVPSLLLPEVRPNPIGEEWLVSRAYVSAVMVAVVVGLLVVFGVCGAGIFTSRDP